ncbi:NfeD family protein [Prevotella sp. AGR2160]|uniref:NfeD family protein n=1 Tax=Prevotella sp. AGR2160 TaxID=1280674 RepID=UPI00041F912A|nr:NfeD family protein [Prevotella sp. AGR2160]
MIDYISANLWLLWCVVTFVCLILELTSGDFFVTCFAIGGLVAIVSAVIGLPFWLQVLIWAAFSVLSIKLIRPRLLKALHKGGDHRVSNADALIGRVGTVIEEIRPGGSGYVQVDGDQWKAVSDDPEPIHKGEKVKIVSRESIIVKVKK